MAKGPRSLIYCDSDGGVKTMDGKGLDKYLGHAGFTSRAEFKEVTGVDPTKMIGMHWCIRRDRVFVYGPAIVNAASTIQPTAYTV